MRLPLVLACALFALALSSARAAPPRLEIAVDPRVELLSALLDTSAWPEYGASWTREDISYRRSLRRTFQRHKEHEAVRVLNEMQRNGFVFDAPVSFIVHLSPPPELAQVVPWEPELVERAGGVANLDKLRRALKAFAADTRFERFFARHRPFYDELVASARRVAPGDDAIALLERHYGARHAAYSILLAPMFGRGNFGVQRPEAGSEHLYFIGGAATWKGDVAHYDASVFRRLVFHEFGHSFSNPVLLQNEPLWAPHAALFERVKEQMTALHYGAWETTLIELMNRTHEIRLVELAGHAAEAKQLLDKYVSKGFIWLPQTLARLREYEENRDRYPTYASFGPRMMQVVAELR